MEDPVNVMQPCVYQIQGFCNVKHLCPLSLPVTDAQSVRGVFVWFIQTVRGIHRILPHPGLRMRQTAGLPC